MGLSQLPLELWVVFNGYFCFFLAAYKPKGENLVGIFGYLGKIIYRLPTYDSKELIAAKRYQAPSLALTEIGYDLHNRDTDPLMYGAITPVNDADDLLDSSQIEARAKEIYQLYSK